MGRSQRRLSGAALGAGLAKNSVESNFLTPEQGNKFAERLIGSADDATCQQTIAEYEVAIKNHMSSATTIQCGAYGFVPG